MTITAAISATALWILPRLGAFQALQPSIDLPVGAIRLFGEKVLPVARQKLATGAFSNPQALLGEVLFEFDEMARPWLQWSDWLVAAGKARSDGHRPPALTLRLYARAVVGCF